VWNRGNPKLQTRDFARSCDQKETFYNAREIGAYGEREGVSKDCQGGRWNGKRPRSEKRRKKEARVA